MLTTRQVERAQRPERTMEKFIPPPFAAYPPPKEPAILPALFFEKEKLSILSQNNSKEGENMAIKEKIYYARPRNDDGGGV